MPLDRRYHWPLGIGIATLCAVCGGIMLGDRAAADISPFYTNLAASQPAIITGEPLTGGGNDAGNRIAEPVDLSYARATASASDQLAEPAR